MANGTHAKMGTKHTLTDGSSDSTFNIKWPEHMPVSTHQQLRARLWLETVSLPFQALNNMPPPPFVTRHSVFNWILKGLRYGNSQFPPFTGRTLAVKYASWSPRVIRFVCCRFSLMLSRYSCTSFRSAPFNCKHAINQGCSETRSISCISINQQLRWDLLQLHNKTNSVRLIGKEWDTK